MYRNKRCERRMVAALLSAMVMFGSTAVSSPVTEVYAAEMEQEIPTSYSSVAEGYTPAVRHQGSFGNCWVHAATAAVEISMIKNGVAAPKDVDLSESHLVYYICRPVADPLGGTDADYTGVLGDTVYNMFHNGGEIGYAAATLLGWMGPVSEEDFYDYDYLYANHNEPTQLEGLNDVEHAYGKRAAIVTESLSVSTYDREEVKRLIMDYGSIGVSYNSDTSNFDYTHSAQYAENYQPPNHAVVIVGWDDEFPKENFDKTPPGDGAWLVRNSWGTGHGIGGYFWLSYYDVTLSGGSRVFRAVAPDKYDKNYRYDRTGNDVGYVSAPEKGSVEAANVFKIQGEKEILKAVQFGIQWDNTNYSIQIYKNPENAKVPTTGEALLDTPIRGTQKHDGHYTVDLGEKIVLEKDDVIAVAITFTADNPKISPAAQTGHTGVCRVGESVYRINGGEWRDCGEEGGQNFLIRAFTSDITETSETHQHEWSEEWSSNAEAHWHDCKGSNNCVKEHGNGYAQHRGGTANCGSRAVCEDCGNEYGLRDASVHVGGKVRRNVRAATTTMTGYTGDICCSSCNLIWEEGEVIPMLDKESETSQVKKVPNLEYTFMSLNGEEVSSKAEGKPKLIMFYGAGCGHCVNTLDNITDKTIEGVDICAVEVNQSSKERIFELKDTLGVGKDNIKFCYDSETIEAYQSRIAYEQAFNGMTYSSLPVLCYIDENNQISQMTSGEQTYNQVKTNLALYCNLKTKNLDVPNPSDMSLKTLEGEEFTLAANGKPKVIIFFAVNKSAINTFAAMPSGTIPGADLYAIDLLSGSDEQTQNFVDQYMYNVKGIKVARSQDAIPEMVKYAAAANVTENIEYPIICYIDAENQLQHVTFGVSSLEQIKMNLALNCGYQGAPMPSSTPEPTKTEEVTPEPTETEEVTPEPTETEEVTPEPTETEEVTPEPTETEEVTPEPTETEEVTPEPTETEEVTPEPTETEEVTPEPTETEEVTPEPTETEEVTPEPTETEEATPEPTETPEVTVKDIFDDVYEDWYTGYVQYVYDKGLMSGIKGTRHFAPNANITKAQVAQVLYNIEGQPDVTDVSVFDEITDVYAEEWYADAVAWAYANGVVTGDLNKKEFLPNTDVTREQLALMMFRYAKHKGNDVSAASDFAGLANADKVADWSMDGMKWAVGEGLISGAEVNGRKDLDPQGSATRAQVAAILQRFCEAYK